jgi:hypothetical protein
MIQYKIIDCINDESRYLRNKLFYRSLCNRYCIICDFKEKYVYRLSMSSLTSFGITLKYIK